MSWSYGQLEYYNLQDQQSNLVAFCKTDPPMEDNK